MDNEELKNFLSNKIETALNDEDGDVSEVRQDNFNRYYGKQYGNERDGFSKFTTRESFEAVEWALPSLLRVFTANEKAVQFMAENEQDEERADEETDIANYYIQIKNNGFLTLHNWAKDILMNPNGYVKVYAEEKKVVNYERFKGVTDLELNKLEEQPNAEIIEADSYQQYVPDYGEQTLYDIRIKYVKDVTDLKITPVPPDEMLVDDQHLSIDVEDSAFICHRTRKSVSDLVQMGYDADELLALGDTEDNTWNDERVNRLFYEEESPDADDEGDQEGASRMLWVHDMCVKVDYDDDNVAERRHIVMIGDEIFDNEEDNYNPYIACSSIIIPHKHIGMSYVESVKDLQLLSTTLTRQLLDNTYAQTNKRHYFNESSLLEDNSTLDNYLDGASSLVIVRGNPNEAVMPEVTQSITGEMLQVIQHAQEKTKLRTGVAPDLSLDPNVLQQSTKGAFLGALEQASQRLEMLVRVFAELGYKPMMQKVHYLIRNFINNEASVKIRGKWVQYKPSTWPDRTNMQVLVGLGHNNTEQKMQLLMGVLNLQKEAMGQNLSDVNKIYNTLQKLIEAANIGNASSFFNDPKGFVEDPITKQKAPWKPPQPPEDPNMKLAVAQEKALAEEQQRKMFEAQQKAQLDMQKLQQEMQKMQATIMHQQEQMRLESLKVAADKERQETELEMKSANTVADIRKSNASTELTEAQTMKALADVGKTEADTKKTELDTSEEYRAAQEILDNESSREEAASESEQS